MKKLFLSMSLMLAALTLTNCTKDAAEDKAIVDNGKGFSFTANIDGVGDTKATLEGVKTVWEAGDQVGFGGIKEGATYATARLYGFDYVSGNVFSSAKSTFSTPNQFYAIFPTALDVAAGSFLEVYTANYTDDATKVNTSKNYIAVSGQNMTQVGASAAHVPAYSPMYWMSNGAISPENLAVQFHHTTSLMKFTVVNTEDAVITVKGVRLSVPADTKIAGTYYINFANGELIPSGSNYVYNSASVAVENAPALAKGESFDVYMPVAPFALAAGDAVTVVVTTTDGSICTVEKTMAAAIAFEAGKINTATVNFVKDAVSETPMTVSELAQALEAGASLAGKKVVGFVSALAPTAADNFSQGTLIITDNSGNEYSAVKFFSDPKKVSNGIATYQDLAIGDELEIDLTNGVIGEYGGKQITGITVDDVIEILSTGTEIVAKEVTIAEYNANYKAYNNMYLKFVDVEPTVAGEFTGTIDFTNGTDVIKVFGRSQWTAGKIEIAKIKGTLYGIGQVYEQKDKNGNIISTTPQICPATVADIEAFAAPFTVDKESVSFTADGGTETVKVTIKKAGYTLGAVGNTATWLTVTPASDGTILFTAAANTETVARDVNVTVAVMKDGAAFATITIAVSQKAAGDTTVEEVATFIAQDWGIENGNYVETVTEKDITLTFAQNGNTNGPKYYSTGTGVRLYPKNTMTVKGGTITKIEFIYTQGDNKSYCTLTANPAGTISDPTWTDKDTTWTGNAENVTFTAGGAKHIRISKIIVTYTK